jgi:hypothetical protein
MAECATLSRRERCSLAARHLHYVCIYRVRVRVRVTGLGLGLGLGLQG